ncbi:MAG TPA: glucose PTS transporter subunit IIA, partial [Thermoanaerobaculia bacterium]|nr:glucose PTS transporter subunit IIA [Thermoanaerobaculia bacterium]
MILVAPIDGWLSALDEVPDPVFAGKVMGDGMAIDPTSATLCAPCDGEVIALHAAKHAVTVRATTGAEILLHVGCDTVALSGDGFETHVRQGQTVRAGEPLVSFDLDGVAPRVPSLVTPVIVMNGAFEVVRREEPRALKVGEFLMELRAVAPARDEGNGDGPELRKQLRVPFEHGIHARPAALLAGALRGLVANVRAEARGRTANARSAVAWMELGVQRGDEITLVATGRDAGAALAALENALAPPPVRGVIASRGIAIGPAARIPGLASAPNENGAGADHERAELDRARGIVRAQLERLHATSTGLAREVLEAHRA